MRDQPGALEQGQERLPRRRQKRRKQDDTNAEGRNQYADDGIPKTQLQDQAQEGQGPGIDGKYLAQRQEWEAIFDRAADDGSGVQDHNTKKQPPGPPPGLANPGQPIHQVQIGGNGV